MNVANFVTSALAPLPIAASWEYLYCKISRRQLTWRRVCTTWMWASGGGGIGNLSSHDAVALIASAVNFLLAAFFWWRSRKGRKRASAALGAKSRALRDALVAKVRERSVSRPALRPVPGGVS